MGNARCDGLQTTMSNLTLKKNVNWVSGWVKIATPRDLTLRTPAFAVDAYASRSTRTSCLYS